MKFLFHPSLLFFISLCLQSGESLAQVFQHISEKEGALRNVVYSITQDKTGFMWFSTTGGLYKYDSHTFKRFVYNPEDSTSLASSYTTSVYSDSHGIIWVCTLNGLCRYDSKTESFTTFKPIDGESQSISTRDVNCVAEDNGKNLWIGTNDGLNRVEVRDGQTKFVRFYLNKPNEPKYAVRGIAKGKDEELWLATSNGLVLLNQGKTQFFRGDPDVRFPSINDFTYILNDKSGSIWLGIREGGLIRFDISSHKFEIIEEFKAPDGRWPDLTGFELDKDNKLWIATFSGLVNFNVKTRNPEWFVNSASNDQSLADNALLSIYKDRQNGLWLGSYSEGLDYLNTSVPQFSRWPFFIERAVKSNYIDGWMGMTPDQQVWLISRDKKQILFYNRKINEVKSYNLNLDFANYLNHFFIDEKEVLWCGGGWFLRSYDFRKNIRKDYPFPNPKDTKNGRAPIYKIIQARDGRLWFCGNFGLLSFDKKTATFRDTGIDGVTTSILEDSKGNIWAGAKDEVWFLQNGTGKPRKIGLNRPKHYDRKADVWKICEDQSGKIWLALGDGLWVYNSKNGIFEESKVNSNGRLAGANDIQSDKNGYLWVSTGYELIRYHPDKNTFQYYSYPDGLPKKSLLAQGGSSKDTSGVLYYNTNYEMFSLNPDLVSTNNSPEAIVLSSLKLFDKPVKANDDTGVLNQDPSTQKELIFRHDQNIFTLNFALLSYIRSHENNYSYRMEGFDQEWHESKTPSATYMNLPSGEYTFVVKAANGDGYWMKEPLKVKITVLPPLWKTWYAYLFYILAIAGVVYAITRFLWIRSVFRKESALNEIKLDFFTNVSHEIRTHLSLIRGPLEKSHQLATDGTAIGNYLSFAKNSSDQLMSLVNELLDFRKMQNGNSKLHVRDHELIRVVKSTLASFEHLALEKNIETNFFHPDNNVLLWFDLAQMQKVLYNLLSNAYKFTTDGGKVTVHVSETHDEVNIAVEDTGKGISTSDLQKLFTFYYQTDSDTPGYGIGLALSKSIVELHHGVLLAESRESSDYLQGGTKMTIKLQKGNQHFTAEQITTVTLSPIVNTARQSFEIQETQNKLLTENRPALLIIEDNDSLRAFLVELLSADYDVLEADNGVAGLETANEKLPDIVLCDVMMPGMNGIEVCNRLKNTELTSHIPVVLLTAKTQNEQIIEGLSSGADAYVLKPFDPLILETKLRNLVRLREELKKRYRQTLLTDNNIAASIADSVNDAFIAKAKSIVVENIGNRDFGVNELAHMLGVSTSVLYRKMKSLTGMTINDFIKTIRLNEARNYMESGVYQVSEVAAMVGFESSKYFSLEFKKAFGKTPTEIRRHTH